MYGAGRKKDQEGIKRMKGGKEAGIWRRKDPVVGAMTIGEAIAPHATEGGKKLTVLLKNDRQARRLEGGNRVIFVEARMLPGGVISRGDQGSLLTIPTMR